jgi:hypothetical protein
LPASGVKYIEAVIRSRQVAVTIESVNAKLQSLTEGEADFEAVFQAHWSRVYAVIFRLVGDHAEAEDLALEVSGDITADRPARGGTLPAGCIGSRPTWDITPCVGVSGVIITSMRLVARHC